MAFASSGRVEEAFQAWRHALELRDRHMADVHVLIVRTVQHAAAQFAQISRLQPYNAEMQRSAAVALLATGEQEGAILHIRAALRLDPSADVQQQAGRMFAPSRPKEAAALLRVAVRVHPRCHALAYLMLARLECSMHGEAGDVCARGWLQAFQCATAAELPDPELLHTTASSAGKLLYGIGRADEARAVGARATALRGLLHPMQMPRELVRGVSALPWRDDAASWRAVRLLEERAEEIRAEVLALHARGMLLPAAGSDSENLVDTGRWKELNFIFKGSWVPLAMQLLPTTFKIVTSLPEASSMVLGATKISVMEPGTHVLAHTGLTNARMRIHLGLSGLDGVYIRVGDSTRQWRDGRCIVFDDSFVHEVWHNGTQTRIVLIVDIWHVEMDEAARQASILASSERDELVAAYQNNRAQFGPDNWF